MNRLVSYQYWFSNTDKMAGIAGVVGKAHVHDMAYLSS